ncbi:unnamed protein product [Auanema sp. JU1783]|nr:unnamed protein product [Auanema sp. JU1783]
MGVDEKKSKLKILQVSNISVSATREQIYNMLHYIGKIEDLKIYPSDGFITSSTTHRVAFVKYDDDRCVEVGQHLTNTVLIDRAILCIPWLQPTIPDEGTFMNSGPAVAGQRQLPPHVSNKVQRDEDGVSMLLTVDPTLEQLGLPAYPLLPGDTDLNKVEEIRRTVYVGNLPKGVDGQTILDFFNIYIGEVMYVRMAIGPESLPCSYAYVEFSQQSTVPIALQNNGTEFQGRMLKIQHSRVAILKPQQKTADQALEEVEEAIRMGRAAGGDAKKSRSRSPRRRRSPSPRRERRRSTSRDNRRRSKSRDRRRSKSRDRRRSRSRDKRRERSRSTGRRDRSRSRDRKRSHSRDRKRDRRDRRRSRSRSKDKKKDRRDRSSDHRKEKRDNKENDKYEKMEVGEEEKLRDKLLEKAARNGDVEMEEVSEKIPSKIKNERKRRDSDSD